MHEVEFCFFGQKEIFKECYTYIYKLIMHISLYYLIYYINIIFNSLKAKIILYCNIL